MSTVWNVLLFADGVIGLGLIFVLLMWANQNKRR